MPRSYSKDRHATRDSRPYLWEAGCNYCMTPFKKDEHFIAIEIEDGFNDEVYAYHKHPCFGRAKESLNLENL